MSVDTRFDGEILLCADGRSRVQEAPFPRITAAALAALLLQAIFHLIPDSGHQIMLEQPDAVTTLLFERIGSG